MKKIVNIRELQLIEYDILKQFDKYCKKNNLKYFLGFGTLLGAVRHKGFIPWDDDMDVIMDPKDYKRFMETFRNKEFSEHIKVRCPDDYRGRTYSHVIRLWDDRTSKNNKFYSEGACLDIIPYGAAPDSQDKYNCYRKHIISVIKLLGLKNYYPGKNILKNFIKRILTFFISKVFYNIIYKRYISIPFDYDIDKYNTVIIPLAGRYFIDREARFPKSYFISSLELKFEDALYPVPIEYKKLLENWYGNYMSLPPESERQKMMEIFYND